MNLDIRKLQSTLGVTTDGIAGPNTWRAFFQRLGAKTGMAVELALAANKRFPEYGVADNPLRLAHFMAQLLHESGSFRWMEELWGPTKAQRGYEGRADLGNTMPGDGYRFRGRGPIQLTGRANYRRFGQRIGVALEEHPEIAAVPSIGLWTALEYWRDRGLNALADADDIEGITRKVNGGLNGFAERKAMLAKVKGLLA